MTRETKIGLLIGLGFIVVFAMLLAHSGSVPPVDEQLPVARHTTEGGDIISPALTRGGVTGPASGTMASRTTQPSNVGTARLGNEFAAAPTGGSEKPAFRQSLLDGRLPSPVELGPSPSEWTSSESAFSTPLTGRSPSGIADAGRTVETHPRVAPALPSTPVTIQVPQPTPRAQQPEVSSPPNQPATPQKNTPLPQEEEKEYIVRRGDTLLKIAKEQYDNTTTKAVDFLVDLNKGRIKDRNTVIEGQKLILPAYLPPDMFELVSGINMTTPHSNSIRESESGQPRPMGERRAPTAVLVDPAKMVARSKTGTEEVGNATLTMDRAILNNAPPTKLSDKSATLSAQEPPARARVYEVQIKDTLSSISAKELGSATLWTEIQRLNKDLDPKKLQPGMKIHLPAKRPVSSGTNVSRVAA